MSEGHPAALHRDVDSSRSVPHHVLAAWWYCTHQRTRRLEVLADLSPVKWGTADSFLSAGYQLAIPVSGRVTNKKVLAPRWAARRGCLSGVRSNTVVVSPPTALTAALSCAAPSKRQLYRKQPAAENPIGCWTEGGRVGFASVGLGRTGAARDALAAAESGATRRLSRPGQAVDPAHMRATS